MSTAEAIVAFQNSERSTQKPRICEEVFENMQFVTDNQSRFGRRLVTEFEYDKKTGQIFYDIAEQESTQNGYARLVTLNSWYLSLLQALLCVTFSAIDIQGNIMLWGSLFYEEETAALFPYTRWGFVALWSIMIAVACVIAVVDARKEWKIKASPVVGDIVNQSNMDSWGAFFALIVFRFFDVEKQVKDVVILLHPWKAVQPFAALKCEGSRCYVLGYPTEHLFRTENRAGQHRSMVVMTFLKVTVLAAKIYFLIWQFRVMVLLAICSAAPSVAWALSAWWRHSADRERAKRWLERRLRDKRINYSEIQAIRQILKLHWGVDVDQASRAREHQKNDDDIPRRMFSGAVANLEERCHGCGRKHRDKQHEKLSCCQEEAEFETELEASEFQLESAPGLPGETTAELLDASTGTRSVKPWSKVRMVMAGYCEWERAIEEKCAIEEKPSGILTADGPDAGSFVAPSMVPPEVKVGQQTPSAEAGRHNEDNSPGQVRLSMNIPRVAWQSTGNSPRKGRHCALLFSREPSHPATAGMDQQQQQQQQEQQQEQQQGLAYLEPSS